MNKPYHVIDGMSTVLSLSENPFLKYFLIFFASFAYQLFFLQYGFNLWDEGALLNGASRVASGDIPLVDFNGYPPGRYYFVWFFWEIFGQSILVARQSVALLTAAAVPCLYVVSRRVMGHPYCFFPPLLFLLAPSVYYNRFFVVFTIFNLFVLVGLLQAKSLRWVWGGVAFVFFTFFFKVEIGCISLLLFLFTLLVRKGEIPLHVLPFVSVFAIGSFFYFFEHGKEAYYQVFETYSKWGNPFPSLLSLGFWAHPLRPEFFENILFYFPPVIYFYTLISLWVGFSRGEKQTDKTALVMLVLLFGVATYGLVIWRAGFDNLVRVLPTAFVLFFYLLAKKRTGRKQQVIAFLMSLAVVWYAYNMALNHGFYAGSIGELRGEHRLLDLGGTTVYANPVEVSWANEVVQYVRENTEASDTIFSIPLNPIWYYLTRRENPTYYEWILPGTMKTDLQEAQIVQRLRQTRPKLVIYADVAIDNVDERLFSRYAKSVYGFIMENYYLAKQVGFFKVLKLTDTESVQ